MKSWSKTAVAGQLAGWVAIVLAWLCLQGGTAWGQERANHNLRSESYLTAGPSSDERLLFAVESAMHAHPELYYYVCKDEKGREIVRCLRKATPTPGWKFGEAYPIIPDIDLDRFGAQPQPATRQKLEELCREHNQARAKGKLVKDGPPPHMDGFGPAPGPAPRPVNQPRPTRKQSDPKTRGPEQAAYAVLADQLSQDYQISGEPAGGKLLENLVTAIANGSPYPRLQTAAGRIVTLGKDSEALLEQWKQQREESIRVAETIMRKADQGAYYHDETYTYYDPSADRLVEKTHRYDDGENAKFWAGVQLYAARQNTDEVLAHRIAAQKRFHMHLARSEAWKDLLPEVPEKFAGPKSSRPLLNVRYVSKPLTRPVSEQDILRREHGYSQLFAGKYVAENVSGKELQHVTFAVDWYHFSTLPESTTRHVYYIPRWKAGEEVELSKMLVPDPQVGWKYKVPVSYKDGNANTPPDLELIEMAGVVRAEITVWSNEASQPATRIDFQERIDKIAPVLIGIAEDLVLGPMVHYERSLIVRSLRTFSLILPASSSEAVRMKELLQDPEAAKERISNRQRDGLVEACSPGKRYTNEKTVFDEWNSLGIIFTACDPAGKRIRAELFNPKKPDRTRPLAGYLITDQDGVRRAMLKPVGPSENFSQPAFAPNEMNPFRDDVEAYRFELSDAGLLCRCIQPLSGGFERQYALQATTADDQQLNAAQRRSSTVSTTKLREALDSSRPSNASPPRRGSANSLGWSLGGRGMPAAGPQDNARTQAHDDAQRKQQALSAWQSARRAFSQKNEAVGIRYLKQAIQAAPDSSAGRSAQRLLKKYEP